MQIGLCTSPTNPTKGVIDIIEYTKYSDDEVSIPIGSEGLSDSPPLVHFELLPPPSVHCSIDPRSRPRVRGKANWRKGVI